MGSSVPPIAGAPGGPALVVMPNTGAPVKSATDAASEAARAAIAQTGTAIPPEHHSQNQPRVAAGQEQGGQFAPNTAVRTLPEGTPEPPAAPQPPAPDAGQAPPAPQPGAPGTETPPAAPEGAAGEETQEAAPEGGEAEENELVVKIPGRQPGEEVEIEVSDPEVAERLRQLNNAAMRGDEARALQARVEQQVQEVENVRARIDFDPAGFVLEDVLPENPAAVDHVVLGALSNPEVWRRLAPIINKMIEDPNEYRTIAAEQRSARAETKLQVTTRMQEQAAVRQNFQELQTAVEAIIPPTMSPDQRQVTVQDVFRDLKSYADRYNLLTLPPHEIPTLLAGRLTALGINPVEAAQKIAQALQQDRTTRLGAPRPPAPRAASPTAPATGGKPPARPATPPSGKTFVAAQAKRREVAAIPPSGAGSPGAPTGAFLPVNPDGSRMTTQQALDAHKARLAKGIKSY